MLTVVIWDVQHGSAAYIKTPASKHIVQDLGTGSHKEPSAPFSPLHHLKYKYGVMQLDLVIITHPHGDHLADIGKFDLLDPRILYRPAHLTDDEVWAGNRNADPEFIQKYLEIDRRFVGPIYDNPILPANNGGAEIGIFVPTSCGRSNLNNHSLVTVITYETCKLIIPGDNEPAAWSELLEQEQFRRAISGADILVASHHGRDSGFCRDVFDYFKPKLTVISDGRFCDTSATSRYDEVTSGWTVHRRDGSDVERKCVTTRSDGVILIKIWRDPANGRPVLSVTID